LRRKTGGIARGFRATVVGAVAVVTLVLGGCASSRFEPIARAEVIHTAQADLNALYGQTEAIDHDLTLSEAIARALKYNLDERVKLMETAVAKNIWDAGRYDMLPQALATAGYRDRNKDLITNSTDSVTGEPSLAHPYVSSDRSVVQTGLSFTWSLLDFGQSYYMAKVNADRALIAAEHQRKAMHLLIQDVRSAFWRAASAQRLNGAVEAALRDGEQALALSRKAGDERLRSPLDTLRFQRQLLENLRLLEAVQRELASARVELAALIRAPLAKDLRVVEPDMNMAAWWEKVPAEKMEEQAIARNADLTESFYNVRMATAEARRGLLRLLPGLSFSYSLNHSNDSYLINKNWNDVGVHLSHNLLGLLAWPAQKRSGESGVALAEAQRQAALMGLLARVHLARLALENTYQQYQRTHTIWQVDRDIAAQIANRADAQAQSGLDRVANQTNAILSELRRYQALAQVYGAASKLQATLGAEPDVRGAAGLSVAELTRAVQASLERWDRGEVFALSDDAAAPAPQ
jgi:outer membrane protein TolC